MTCGNCPAWTCCGRCSSSWGSASPCRPLAQATLGAPKSADGLQAVRWWRQGRLEELERYCRRDVELTRDLFRFGQEKGYLLYQRKEGPTLRVPVDWSWPSLRRRFGPKA